MKKRVMNEIIEALSEIGRKHNSGEYGLPILDEGQMSLMREAIREILDPEETDGN